MARGRDPSDRGGPFLGFMAGLAGLAVGVAALVTGDVVAGLVLLAVCGGLTGYAYLLLRRL